MQQVPSNLVEDDGHLFAMRRQCDAEADRISPAYICTQEAIHSCPMGNMSIVNRHAMRCMAGKTCGRPHQRQPNDIQLLGPVLMEAAGILLVLLCKYPICSMQCHMPGQQGDRILNLSTNWISYAHVLSRALSKALNITIWPVKRAPCLVPGPGLQNPPSRELQALNPHNVFFTR